MSSMRAMLRTWKPESQNAQNSASPHADNAAKKPGTKSAAKVSSPHKASKRLRGEAPNETSPWQGHILVMAGAVIFQLFSPSLVQTVAQPAVLAVASLYIPLICTIAVIYQRQQILSEEETQKEGQPQNPPNNSQQQLHCWKRQPSRGLVIPSTEETLEEEIVDWLRFWMIRSVTIMVKASLAGASSEFKSALLPLELWLYVWIYTVPFIPQTPISHRPLRLLCQHVGPSSVILVEAASQVVPLEWWQTNVVKFSLQFLNTLVLVKIMEQRTADWLQHIVQEGRTLVVPAVLTLMAPGSLNQMGVVYVKYALSMAKSFQGGIIHSQTAVRWMQYWVLHALVDALLYYCLSPVLWLIPFSTHALFALWFTMTSPSTIDKWYGEVVAELQLLGLLPAATEKDVQLSETKTAKFLALLIQLLPRAHDADEFILSQHGTGGAPEATTSDNQYPNEKIIVKEQVQQKDRKAIPVTDPSPSGKSVSDKPDADPPGNEMNEAESQCASKVLPMTYKEQVVVPDKHVQKLLAKDDGTATSYCYIGGDELETSTVVSGITLEPCLERKADSSVPASVSLDETDMVTAFTQQQSLEQRGMTTAEPTVSDTEVVTSPRSKITAKEGTPASKPSKGPLLGEPATQQATNHDEVTAPTVTDDTSLAPSTLKHSSRGSVASKSTKQRSRVSEPPALDAASVASQRRPPKSKSKSSDASVASCRGRQADTKRRSSRRGADPPGHAVRSSSNQFRKVTLEI